MAFVGQLLKGVFTISGISDLPVGSLCIPVAEAVMVAGDKSNVLHTRIFGSRYPLAGIEGHRVKKMQQSFIFPDGYVALVHYPFTRTEHAESAPVDKHTKLHILELSAGGHVFGCGCV